MITFGGGLTADEFLIEPISGPELVLAIRQLVKSDPRSYNLTRLRFGDLTYDQTNNAVLLRGSTLPLEQASARILGCIMTYPLRAWSWREIREYIWGVSADVDDRTIDVYIGRIRNCLKHKVIIDPIVSIRSVGYCMNEEFQNTDSFPKRRSRTRLDRTTK